MQIKYILAAAIVAMLAVPGTASQLAARNAMSAPLIPAPMAVSTDGLFSDPDVVPQLSITLPTKFTAIEIGTHPLQSFNG